MRRCRDRFRVPSVPAAHTREVGPVAEEPLNLIEDCVEDDVSLQLTQESRFRVNDML